MICKNCGTKMTRDVSKVYTSIPARYEYKCPKCGWGCYGTIEEDADGVDEQEHVNRNLEEEVRRWWKRECSNVDKKYTFDRTSGHFLNNETIIELARHFAQWQYKKDFKEAHKTLTIAHMDGIEEGKRIMKDQMMKDVVLETTIIKDWDGCAEDGNESEWLAYEDDEVINMPEWCEEGDKVKLILIKSEQP